MFLVQLGHRLLILGLGEDLLLFAALRHRRVILVEVLVQIALRVGDELGDLILVLGLHRLGLLQLLLVLGQLGGLLLLGVDLVPLQAVDAVVQIDDLVGSVFPEGVDLLLDSAHILVNGRSQLTLLLSCEDFRILCHMQYLPFIGILHSVATALPGRYPWY